MGPSQWMIPQSSVGTLLSTVILVLGFLLTATSGVRSSSAVSFVMSSISATKMNDKSSSTSLNTLSHCACINNKMYSNVFLPSTIEMAIWSSISTSTGHSYQIKLLVNSPHLSSALIKITQIYSCIYLTNSNSVSVVLMICNSS